MGGDTLYWLFSTIAQTYGAITGIIGLLVVYRLDNQSRLRGAIRDRLLDPQMRFLPKLFGNETYGWSSNDIVSNFQKPNKENKDKLERFKKGNERDYIYLKNEIKKINNSISLGRSVRVNFMLFGGFHFLFIIVPSTVAIFFVQELNRYTCSILWLLLLILLISFILIIILSSFLIKTRTKDAPFKEPI